MHIRAKEEVPSEPETVVKSLLIRTDVPGTDAAVDGIAELWFEDRAALDLPNARPGEG
jgi:hypothetical protein